MVLVFVLSAIDQTPSMFPAVNRLDRLTSGLMIIPTTVEAARAMTDEFFNGTVQKEYVARCWGEFPAYVILRKNNLARTHACSAVAK